MKGPTDNRPAALGAKVELREHALEHVGADNAHVLDAFCGEGILYDKVWHRAASYAGIDKRLCWPPKTRRFCGDNRRILRAIGLQSYNVFDLDAYGSPWHAALVIADRRPWKEGELGAAVFTSGASAKTRWGGIGRDMQTLLGRKTLSIPTGLGFSDDLHRWCVQAWLTRAQVELVDMWDGVSRSSNRGSKSGSTRMNYTAVTFRGRGLPARNPVVAPPYEHRPDRRARKLARNAVRNAVRRGDIQKGPCAHHRAGGCQGKLEAHHIAGYDEEHWLDVVWYCERHHELVHILEKKR